ncbi:hypothetical protein N9917_01145 [Deltaproteobacteria bacterium]|nr:hypothetical protein [Deltaproteobacteria bacterium]
MNSRIYALLNPSDPALAEGRAAIWAALQAQPAHAVRKDFKCNRRWYSVLARPGALIFRYRSSGKPVSAEMEAKLVRFLMESA